MLLRNSLQSLEADAVLLAIFPSHYKTLHKFYNFSSVKGDYRLTMAVRKMKGGGGAVIGGDLFLCVGDGDGLFIHVHHALGSVGCF